MISIRGRDGGGWQAKEHYLAVQELRRFLLAGHARSSDGTNDLSIVIAIDMLATRRALLTIGLGRAGVPQRNCVTFGTDDMTQSEDPLDFVVANFGSLEDELLSCMRYVPYIEQNKAVVSPKFVPILLDACSLIDSVFRHQVSAEGKHNLKSYASMLARRLDLEDATTLLLVSPLQLLRPFRGWENTAPPWWSAYNRIKHDRIGNYAEASYGYTVLAMAALHQVLARSWIFLGNLSKAGWFNESDDEGIMNLGASRCAGSGPPELPVESKLFVSPIRSDFVDWATEPPTIEFEHWNFSERVKNFIWEEEGW